MSRIEIEIMSTTSASAAFADAWNRAAAGETISPRIAFGSYVEAGASKTAFPSPSSSRTKVKTRIRLRTKALKK